MRMTHLERFESKYTPEPNSGCWLWISRLDKDGYGMFTIQRKRVRAHRFAYELFIKAIPANLQLDHKCRVRCCVNPFHLEPVSLLENKRRGVVSRNGKNGIVSVITGSTCMRGHEYEPGSYWVLKGNQKQCKRCFYMWRAASKPMAGRGNFLNG